MPKSLWVFIPDVIRHPVESRVHRPSFVRQEFHDSVRSDPMFCDDDTESLNRLPFLSDRIEYYSEELLMEDANT